MQISFVDHKYLLVFLPACRYSLSQATMEQGRFLLAGEELEKQEEVEMKNKAEASAGRIRKENITAMAVERRRRMREKYEFL